MSEFPTGISFAQAHYPGAVFDLVPSMKGLIVGRSGLPHLPENFQPALAQAAQGAGVALALGAFALVVDFGPGALAAAAVGTRIYETSGVSSPSSSAKRKENEANRAKKVRTVKTIHIDFMALPTSCL